MRFNFVMDVISSKGIVSMRTWFTLYVPRNLESVRGRIRLNCPPPTIIDCHDDCKPIKDSVKNVVADPDATRISSCSLDDID